jgi:hypothetical protein
MILRRNVRFLTNNLLAFWGALAIISRRSRQGAQRRRCWDPQALASDSPQFKVKAQVACRLEPDGQMEGSAFVSHCLARTSCAAGQQIEAKGKGETKAAADEQPMPNLQGLKAA